MIEECQKRNVYDFDKTIYSGDATVDFWKFCVRQNPKILLAVPRIAVAFGKYLFGVFDKTEFKEVFFSFLRYVSDVDLEVSKFWEINVSKIQVWYLDSKKDSDLIISASPEFLLRPVCDSLGVALIASRVDKRTGKFSGKNCYGEEKVSRFFSEYAGVEIEEFFSDSLSDSPLAEISQKAFIVSDGARVPWSEYHLGGFSKMKQTFLSQDFLLFVFCGGMGTLTNFVCSLAISTQINPTLAYVCGYGLSLFVSYALNAFLIFHEKLKAFSFVKFVLSYIPNFLILFVFVCVFLNIFGWNKVIVYALAALFGLPVTFILVKIFAFKKSVVKDG